MNPTLSTLHTVNKSAFSSDALASCLRMARSGDVILLMEDGVYNAVQASALVGAGLARDALPANQSRAGLYALGYAPTESFESVRIYALQEDLQARGIAVGQLAAHVEPISYADFVSLVCTHARTVSWF